MWLMILPYGVLGLATLMALSGGAVAWEYTNSPEFCGTSCHTMPPEYTSYLTSPHARVDCVDCHIGKGFIATRITRKAGDIRHVIATTFSTYEFPIRAKTMRPARETCELCHFPEKFSDDSLREIQSFANDLENTPKSTYLVLKTGGGSERVGQGRGIHWHIINQVYFVAEDREQQSIPYVRVIEDDGTETEYVDIDSKLTESEIAGAELVEMDCITCHNRITHIVSTPEDTVDGLISGGIISASIPEIRRKAIEVYSQRFETTGMGLSAIAGLTNYYRVYHKDFYAENADLVEAAIAALQEAYGASVYPEQKSDWTTHPNNVGHKDTPGCFRCHDGKHLSEEGEAIRLECNLCHSIPVVAGPQDFVTDVEISRGPEPESHRNSNWISVHHELYSNECQACHTTEDPGGTSNTSFCSNSACHGSSWDYAGFDAPGLRETLLEQFPPTPTPGAAVAVDEVTYENTIGPLLTSQCGACHGPGGMEGLDVTSYASLMKGGVSGQAIVPGDSAGSLLVQKQSGTTPHFSQLTGVQLEQVANWIAAGAPEK